MEVKEFYVCSACHNTYEKGWSDEESDKEAKELFGVENAHEKLNDGYAVVCDDCFNEMRKQGLF